MLETSPIVAFVPTTDPARARRFFGDVLGLPVLGEDRFALVLDANGVQVRVVNVAGVAGYQPAPFTILGWRVPDIRAAALELQGRGVALERFPGMPQDDLGIWSSPSGARVAWFKDPDGNLLSVTE
jgi:catechol 2,3-dioxygenase-like lactoylglutathione lyase family enzyme